jgi:hypothetical protein
MIRKLAGLLVLFLLVSGVVAEEHHLEQEVEFLEAAFSNAQAKVERAQQQIEDTTTRELAVTRLELMEQGLDRVIASAEEARTRAEAAGQAELVNRLDIVIEGALALQTNIHDFLHSGDVKIVEVTMQGSRVQAGSLVNLESEESLDIHVLVENTNLLEVNGTLTLRGADLGHQVSFSVPADGREGETFNVQIPLGEHQLEIVAQAGDEQDSFSFIVQVGAMLADQDGDTILDETDNCPAVSNQNQLDTDTDGEGDVCDLDDDNDTILDQTDNCPLIANAGQEDEDTDGTGDACELDTDGDGVNDDDDNCSLVANPLQENTDGDQLGDVCDGNNEQAAIGSDFDRLKERFDRYEDSYRENRRKYLDAKEDKNSRDMLKYKDRLQSVDDKLENLDDDIETLIQEVSQDDLMEQLEDLESDVSSIRNRIEDLLTVRASTTPAPPLAPPPAPATPPIVIEPFQLPDFPVQNVGQKELTPIVWLIAGIVIFFAVIVFLLGVLFL